jgi:hypothetical protein
VQWKEDDADPDLCTVVCSPITAEEGKFRMQSCIRYNAF